MILGCFWPPKTAKNTLVYWIELDLSFRKRYGLMDWADSKIIVFTVLSLGSDANLLTRHVYGHRAGLCKHGKPVPDLNKAYPLWVRGTSYSLTHCPAERVLIRAAHQLGDLIPEGEPTHSRTCGTQTACCLV